MFRLEKKIFVKGPPLPPPAIARSCYVYAAGGMPLAFTQEDFLVLNVFVINLLFEEKTRGCCRPPDVEMLRICGAF